ncbi:MAG: amidohydrolase family protein, partial [Candidatus Aminicenantales bacterium]
MRIRPRLRAVLIGLLSLLLITFILVAIFQKKIAPADLVLINGDIHTLDPARPEAMALVVRGNRIAAVCLTDAEAKEQVGRRTELIDLGRGFVLPGLSDGRVHFDKAGALLNDANLTAVSDEEGLRQEIRRVVALIGSGEWITEGMWGAYERRASGEEGEGGGELRPAWRPHRRMIDDLTPGHPCFLCRFDNIEWLANGAALREAGLEMQPVEGMELDSEGKPTGIIFQPSLAFDRMRAAQ